MTDNETTPLARARVVVSGRVQGVAFRQAAVEEAQRLGVTGWVRNLPDGRVEALIEGDRQGVEALVAWCRRGPRLARVEEMRIAWEPHRGEYQDFRIAR
jgi:acylphosphatase